MLGSGSLFVLTKIKISKILRCLKRKHPDATSRWKVWIAWRTAVLGKRMLESSSDYDAEPALGVTTIECYFKQVSEPSAGCKRSVNYALKLHARWSILGDCAERMNSIRIQLRAAWVDISPTLLGMKKSLCSREVVQTNGILRWIGVCRKCNKLMLSFLRM